MLPSMMVINLVQISGFFEIRQEEFLFYRNVNRLLLIKFIATHIFNMERYK
ncbi:hypothetical protein XBKQ1_400008 [Xenorhabdus bovienii str. kraussei Quebec]|uniref:Uncharacterized protein n=1 Tax=Xenorhabdus bovienii str. kraussei Quebec TaxID=1398203 RepID=A0A077PNF3_XENBV|nr:hypothetical protein XBKQ1_400008 [Xenorhabdus bovienii str. kraussei Quebec]